MLPGAEAVRPARSAAASLRALVQPIADSTANTALQGETSADDGAAAEGLRVIGA